MPQPALMDELVLQHGFYTIRARSKPISSLGRAPNELVLLVICFFSCRNRNVTLKRALNAEITRQKAGTVIVPRLLFRGEKSYSCCHQHFLCDFIEVTHQGLSLRVWLNLFLSCHSH